MKTLGAKLSYQAAVMLRKVQGTMTPPPLPQSISSYVCMAFFFLSHKAQDCLKFPL